MKETKFKQTEVGMIPWDWEVKSLEKVCMDGGIVRGPFGGSLKKEMFISSGYKVYEQKNAIYKNIELGQYFVDASKYREMSRFSIRAGDFIVSCSGTIGKIYRIPERAPEGIINQALLKLTVNEREINSSYFIIYFESDRFQSDIIDDTQGGAMKNLVGMDKFKRSIFAIPPTIEEQQRIANAFSDVDSLINNLEKLIAKKKNIKQGAMQQLLTGRKRLPGFAPAKPTTKQTELGPIPSDWKVKNVGSMMKIGHGRDYKHLKSGTVPVFGTGGYMTSVDSFLYDGKTVCIGRKGTIDKPFYYEGKLWTVDTLFYTYSFNNVLPKYIYYSFGMVDWLSMNEASGVPSLTAKNVEDVLLRIPSSIKEQTAIANVLSDMDSEIQTLETKLAKYRKLKTGMMQQLLTGKIRLV